MFFQLLGITSIFPFMKVASEETITTDNHFFNSFYQLFNLETKSQVIIVLGIAIVTFLLISNSLTIYSYWKTTKFSWDVFLSLEERLLNKYFSTRYDFFTETNTSTLLTTLTSEVFQFCTGILVPIIQLVASLILGIALSSVLFLVEPKVTLIAYLFFALFYLFIFFLKKKFLSDSGKRYLGFNRMRYNTINESLSGIKTLKIYGIEQDFLERFTKTSREFSKIPPKVSTIEFFPKYILEIFAFGGIVFVVIYFTSIGKDINSLIPILSLYAFAGYKMIPAFQTVFSKYAKITHNKINVDTIHEQLFDQTFVDDLGDEKIQFDNQISIENLSFSHLGVNENALNHIDITIPKGSSVAIVGSTGSGKTTLIDLLTGLLRPTNGEILIDGETLNTNNIRAWQNQISYVPQHIFLYDDTIEKNICLGTEEENQQDRMQKAAKVAQIHDFIQTLPDGYQARIGQNGVKLSGGQRQRLGLARAVYRGSKVLILDESTNALDKATENDVLNSIKDFNPGLTLILITHRVSSVKNVDQIILLREGKIQNSGSYDELLESSHDFKGLTDNN